MNGPDYLPTDPPPVTLYLREPCPWCAASGNTPQCIACAGRGWFITEAPNRSNAP